MNEGTDMMTLRDRIRSGTTTFLDAARDCEDAAHPAVAERAEALGEALELWEGRGGSLRDCEASLVAADALLTGLHDLNPEGLPQPLRDAATFLSDVMDAARAEGLDATASDLDPIEPIAGHTP